jgi:hypothetical protein
VRHCTHHEVPTGALYTVQTFCIVANTGCAIAMRQLAFLVIVLNWRQQYLELAPAGHCLHHEAPTGAANIVPGVSCVCALLCISGSRTHHLQAHM